MDCLFCRIINGELPSYKVYEDDQTLAFLDIAPISRGHTLVLPKSHATKITELYEKEISGLFLGLKNVINGIENALSPEGLNMFVNQGEVAGQVVPHLHIHVVPRSQGDDVEFVVPKIKLSEGEFKEIVENISKGI